MKAPGKYAKLRLDFINKLIIGDVENFTDYAKKHGWIKKSLSENGTLARLKSAWENEAMVKISKIQQDLDTRLINESEITIKEALKTKRAVFELIQYKLKNEKLSIKDLKTCWQIARTEAFQPTSINKQKIKRASNQPSLTLADLIETFSLKQPDSTILGL